MRNGEESSIELGQSSNSKGKARAIETNPLIGKNSNTRAFAAENGIKRGVGVLDLIIRICAVAAALGATIAMGTAEQTLPFFTQFFQFQASYTNLPAFTFFVIANAVTTGYLILSLPFSIISIVRPQARAPRLLLVALDTVAVTLTTAGAGSAAAIDYLAHKGNVSANWLPICQQFDQFCQRTSGAVVASFITAVLLIFLIVLSAIALKRP
ncbi:hypothetical protein Droror1_Dr00026374 [Drosera rotundifolia]